MSRCVIRLAVAVWSASWLLFAAGCGGGPALAPVSGTVMYKGKPLVGATVVFYPNGQEGVRSSMGLTDD